MERNSGESEILGELTGVKKDTLELSKEKIISQLRLIVFGQNQKTLGHLKI